MYFSLCNNNYVANNNNSVCVHQSGSRVWRTILVYYSVHALFLYPVHICINVSLQECGEQEADQQKTAEKDQQGPKVAREGTLS